MNRTEYILGIKHITFECYVLCNMCNILKRKNFAAKNQFTESKITKGIPLVYVMCRYEI